MNSRGLRNLIREQVTMFGRPSWKLSTKSGEPIEAFTLFCSANLGYAYATQKRYAEAASKFLDYLYEAEVFDRPVSARYLNAVVNAYPVVLRDGCNVVAKRVAESTSEASENLWLARVASALKWKASKPGSFSNTLAPINLFLKLSESLARETQERASLLGIDTSKEAGPLFDVLAGIRPVSSAELAALKQNSMLGSVAKVLPRGFRRPPGLRAPSNLVPTHRSSKDFPLEYLDSVAAEATSARDRCLWYLLAGSGIRTSEARNLLLDDIDFARQRVYVYDPLATRPEIAASDPISIRFKGRQMANTYIFEPLRRKFFAELENYIKYEYVPTPEGRPKFVFQYVESQHRGEPLIHASDAALGQSFMRAVRRANVPARIGGGNWTLHSLRHLYGVYMLNEFPVNPSRGEKGLRLVEVQMLMGHKQIRTTAKYARQKANRLSEKLEAADIAMLACAFPEPEPLPRTYLGSPAKKELR